MGACLVWLREIAPRTLPGFIPSDHVHPLFIFLEHSPRCGDVIPMLPPPSAQQDLFLPHPSAPLYLNLLSCSLTVSDRGRTGPKRSLQACTCTRVDDKAGGTGVTWLLTVSQYRCFCRHMAAYIILQHFFFFLFCLRSEIVCNWKQNEDTPFGYQY